MFEMFNMYLLIECTYNAYSFLKQINYIFYFVNWMLGVGGSNLLNLMIRLTL